MKQKIARKILTVTSMLLSGVMVTATVICNENATAISSMLNVKTFDVVETGDTNQDSEYYKSNFDNLTDLINAGHSKATEVLEEGAVLLKNENGALPLSKGSKVSLLGVTAYDPVYGGTGSGFLQISAGCGAGNQPGSDKAVYFRGLGTVQAQKCRLLQHLAVADQ